MLQTSSLHGPPALCSGHAAAQVINGARLELSSGDFSPSDDVRRLRPLRDLSSLLPSASSELLGDELVLASLPGDSASRTVPQHSLFCRLLFSSLSASSSWMKGMPSMRRNTDSLGLRSPSGRLPAGTQGRRDSRAGRCRALRQDVAGCQPWQQVPLPGTPGDASTWQ